MDWDLRLGGNEYAVSGAVGFSSFRSNTVLRWEWRPGSTLFVVWQQDRSGELARIAPVGAGSLFDTFGMPASNYLAVKLSYWIPCADPAGARNAISTASAIRGKKRVLYAAHVWGGVYARGA